MTTLGPYGGVHFGEHTRPRVFRPAPSPVGSGAPSATKRCGWSARVHGAGGAPATAPEAGALPISTVLYRLSGQVLIQVSTLVVFLVSLCGCTTYNQQNKFAQDWRRG